MFYILDLSFLLLSAIEFLRNSAIQVKFIIIIIIINMHFCLGGGGVGTVDLQIFAQNPILTRSEGPFGCRIK